VTWQARCTCALLPIGPTIPPPPGKSRGFIIHDFNSQLSLLASHSVGKTPTKHSKASKGRPSTPQRPLLVAAAGSSPTSCRHLDARFLLSRGAQDAMQLKCELQKLHPQSFELQPPCPASRLDNAVFVARLALLICSLPPKRCIPRRTSCLLRDAARWRRRWRFVAGPLVGLPSAVLARFYVPVATSACTMKAGWAGLRGVGVVLGLEACIYCSGSPTAWGFVPLCQRTTGYLLLAGA
jgi:hypothetical protein